MEEKSKNIKRARTIRSDYNSYVDAVQKWLQEVEVKIQDRVVEPVVLKQSVQVREMLIVIYVFMTLQTQNIGLRYFVC